MKRFFRAAIVLPLGIVLGLAAWWLQDRITVRPLPQFPLQLQGKVQTIDDGDSFIVSTAPHGLVHVRLHAIDAPELVQSHGPQARRALAELIADRKVALDCYKADPRGRAVCRVRIGEQDPERVLLERGLAWHYAQFAREQRSDDRRAYEQAQDEARAARRGLWQQLDPMPPSTCRERLRELRGCD